MPPFNKLSKYFPLIAYSPYPYLQAVKKNDFVQALAFVPSAVRYQLPKQRWIANRLGLHRTMLQQETLFHSKRAKLAKTVALLKREPLSPTQAKAYIDDILSPAFAKWHLEFIKDIGFKYPELIFDFVKDNHTKNSYYLGLYLALLLERALLEKNPNLSTDFIQEFQNLLENLDNPLERTILASNAFSHTPQAKLADLNRCLTEFGLLNFKLNNTNGQFTLANLQTVENDLKLADYVDNLVTILVTCYNAQETIEYCLASLQQQTWQNLEIIVIDDASSDSTCDIVAKIAEQDKRIKLMRLPYNVGTYGAKSLGAMWATGIFMTCQDSDDFAHPQKIERQVLPLIDNEKLAVTTSYWLRIDKDGQYYVRQHYPFLRQNPASPLFRREQVQADTGLWHLVRTGADSEIFERLKLVYGKQAVKVIAEPLTLASHRENSLMTSSEFGAYQYQSAVDRLNYWENWRLWHIDTLANQQTLKMPALQQQLQNPDILNVPQKITINPINMAKNLQQFQSTKENL